MRPTNTEESMINCVNTLTNLRVRLLFNPNLVLLLTGHGSRQTHIGRARNRSCEGITVPGLGRE